MIKFVIFLVLLKLILIKGTFDPSKIDYCKLRCHGTRSSENNACECYIRKDIVELTDDIVEFRTQMLKTHNKIRNKAGNGTGLVREAANMNALSYDLELEYMARCYATKTGGFASNYDCRRTSKFENPGQTAGRLPEILNISQIMLEVVEKDWYLLEAMYLDDPLIEPYNNSTRTSKLIKNLIELLWWSQTHVGCARIFITPNTSNSKNPFRVVCNYGGTGPSAVHNMHVYEVGEGCSKCPTGIKCNSKYPYLCGEISPVPTDKPTLISKEKTFEPPWVKHTWSDTYISYVTYETSSDSSDSSVISDRSDTSERGGVTRIWTRNEIFFTALSIILLLLY